MQLGVDGVFQGSGILKVVTPSVKSIVDAVAHYTDAKVIARASENLGGAMKGQEISHL
jgi:pyridoxal 5'-phosphate synthase pdxS subunit